MRTFSKTTFICCVDQLYIKNGVLDIACGGFVFDFYVHSVKNEPQICYGGYPDSLLDIKTIKNHQCTTVFSLMTRDELEMRQIGLDYEQSMCKQEGISYVSLPIGD